MAFNETLRPAVIRVSYISPAIMYVTIEPNLQEVWVLLHWISEHACSSYIRLVCMSVLLSPDQLPRHHCHRSADIFTITQIGLCGTGPAYMSETSRRMCYNFLRPAVMCLCSYPTNRLVSTIAPDQHASILQLHLTSSHVFISSYYQHACLLQFHLIRTHVYYICARPTAMSITIAFQPFSMSLTPASNQQSYL